MGNGDALGVTLRCCRLLPGDLGDEVLWTEFLVKHGTAAVRLNVVEMDPHGPVFGEQRLDLAEPVAQHRKPDRVLYVVLVVQERLAGVERRVDVDEFDLADMPVRVLRDLCEGVEDVHGVAGDEQVVVRRLRVALWGVRVGFAVVALDLVEEPHFGDAPVGRVNERVVVLPINCG